VEELPSWSSSWVRAEPRRRPPPCPAGHHLTMCHATDHHLVCRRPPPRVVLPLRKRKRRRREGMHKRKRTVRELTGLRPRCVRRLKPTLVGCCCVPPTQGRRATVPLLELTAMDPRFPPPDADQLLNPDRDFSFSNLNFPGRGLLQ
jgi:hypothetical protein